VFGELCLVWLAQIVIAQLWRGDGCGLRRGAELRLYPNRGHEERDRDGQSQRNVHSRALCHPAQTSP